MAAARSRLLAAVIRWSIVRSQLQCIVQLSVTQMIIGEDSGFITVKSLHNHVKMALINIFAIKWDIYHFKSDLTGSKYQKETVVNFNSSL